jgi:hypothetical protein
MTDVRANLERLIAASGDDYLSLSRFLGRNAAYVQQFIKRGTPRKLDEDDRRKLATYFGCDEAMLGGPGSAPTPPSAKRVAKGKAMALVPRLAIGASAGPGALVGEEAAEAHLGFETGWLRKLGCNPDTVSIIEVAGDSMVPTLANGDEILVDRSDAADRLRDGIYVLRMEDTLMVKRITKKGSRKTMSISSDNPAHPSWPDRDPASVDVIGRVVWIGRKLV